MTTLHRKKQTGFITIAMAVALLLSSTLLALLSSHAQMLQQKTIRSLYHSQEAFEAAEAGIEFGIANLNTNKTTILVDGNNDGFIDNQSGTPANVGSTTLANGSSYSLIYSNPTPNNFNLIKITAIGTSKDGSITRTAIQQVQYQPDILAPRIPPVAVAIKAAINAQGSPNFANFTSNSNYAIWSGGTTTTQGNVTITVGNPNSSGIKEHDNSFSTASADTLFKNYFGVTQTQLANAANYTSTSGGDVSSALAGMQNKLIWLAPSTGSVSFTGSSVIGSISQPVIIVINGNMSISGNVTIFGLIYVTGNITQASGSAVVNGSLFAGGSADFQGNFTGNYDLQVLSNIQTQLGSFVKVPGSWKDY